MILTLSVCGVTCLGIILSILFKPQIKIKNIQIGTYWLIALIGAIILFATNSISFESFIKALTANSAVNPLKILAIFISMTLMSVFLDSVDFFKYFADVALKKAGNSQFLLFLWLYLIVSILTVFTSNDIIVLTFTPFICYFAKEAKINPIPYLVTEFVSANTWSMLLIIGNPTNIYLASSQGIAFLTYTAKMAIPTIFAGIVSFGVLCLMFFKKFRQPLDRNNLPAGIVLSEKSLVWIGIIHLVLCIVLLVISSYLGWEMWYICLACCLSLYLTVTAYKLIKRERLTAVFKCFKQAPWQLIPFVLSMFVLVLSLKYCGFTDKIAHILGDEQVIMTYGLSSLLVSNLINNIPMSVLYSSILTSLKGEALTMATYSAVIGSNIGAFLTPIGALAGIMFSSLVNGHKVKFTFTTFIKYGFLVALPTILSALAGLELVNYIW